MSEEHVFRGYLYNKLSAGTPRLLRNKMKGVIVDFEEELMLLDDILNVRSNLSTIVITLIHTQF